MVSYLMIVDSRILLQNAFYCFTKQTSMLYHLLSVQYLLLRRLLGGYLQSWWWQISLQIIGVV